MAIHAANPDKSEQLQLILYALREWGECSTKTLHEVSGSMCASTRVQELKARGYLINCERKGGVYFYNLIGQEVPA